MYEDSFLVWMRCSPRPEEWFLKGCCCAEFKKSVQYFVNIQLNSDGSILGTACECSVGEGGMAHCKHVIIILLAAQQLVREVVYIHQKACTDKLQTFHKPRKSYHGTPLKAKDLKRKHSKLENSNYSCNTFDPRPPKYRNTRKVNERVQNSCLSQQNSTMPLKQLINPANPFAIDNDHLYLPEPRNHDFLRKVMLLDVSEKDITNIEERTMGQAENKYWHEMRQYRITASEFYDVVKAITAVPFKNSKCVQLADSILNPKSFSSRSTEHGIVNEPIAVKKFMEHYQGALEAKECGLFISHSHPYLAASPDRLLAELTVIEVKCPFSAKDKAITPLSVPYLVLNEKGKLCLKKSHTYYFQIQGQLFVTGRRFCDLVVFTYQDLQVISIERDDCFIKDMVSKLSLFYKRYFLPALLEKYYFRYYLKYSSFYNIN